MRRQPACRVEPSALDSAWRQPAFHFTLSTFHFADVNLATQANYTQLPGIWGGAFSFKRGSDHFFLHPDFQGHNREITYLDESLYEREVIDAWGQRIYYTGSANLLAAFGQWGYWFLRLVAARMIVMRACPT